MNLKNIFGNSKKSDSFDSLLDETDAPLKNKQKEKTDSFYGEGEDDLFKPSKGGFYGQDSGESKNESKETISSKIFHFSLWEYAIIIIEFLLLIYVILLFAGVFSI